MAMQMALLFLAILLLHFIPTSVPWRFHDKSPPDDVFSKTIYMKIVIS